MKCNWTETLNIKGIDSQGQSLGTKIIYCENTNTKRDKNNITIRYFCDDHLEKVKQIRKLMHKHCINRGKLLDFIRQQYDESLKKNSVIVELKLVWTYLINKIESGEFDND